MQLLRIVGADMACKTEADKERNRIQTARRYAIYRAEGRCTRCSKRLPSGHLGLTCKRCRHMQACRRADYILRHIDEWDEAELCCACHKAKRVDGMNNCKECEAAAQLRKRNAYHALKSEGKCTKCKRRHNGGTAMCARCLAVIREAKAKKKPKTKRKAKK